VAPKVQSEFEKDSSSPPRTILFAKICSGSMGAATLPSHRMVNARNTRAVAESAAAGAEIQAKSLPPLEISISKAVMVTISRVAPA
jgi:hypothetical protein